MAINATNTGGAPREPIPAGNYIARCYKMIQIGNVEELVMGEKKILNKVRIGWELPLETKTFSQEKGEQPLVIDKEFTLSLHEKSNLRAMLKSWRGKDFTEKEAESFDITKLLGVQCMLNIIHKPGVKDPSKVYEQISSITPMPKGVICPPQVNPTFVLSYDDWDDAKFNSLPDFIKEKIAGSIEYAAMKTPPLVQEGEEELHHADTHHEEESDLPF